MESIVKNIDCMVGMAEYPDKYFDLAVVDPPYGINIASKSKLTGNSKKEYEIKNWDENTPQKEYFIELKRVSKNQIIWGANFFDGMGLSGGAIVWNKLGTIIGKRNPMPTLSDCEIAYCSLRNNVKMFSYTQIGNVYGNNYQIDWNQNRIHPTQKPVALYDWIYSKYLPEGGTVLDTHLGSGSNRIAADKAGNIDFIGFELDKDYFEAQEKRWAEYKKQMTLW
jgi:site-specific DNA-methyltransferase (adenine-specific)